MYLTQELGILAYAFAIPLASAYGTPLIQGLVAGNQTNSLTEALSCDTRDFRKYPQELSQIDCLTTVEIFWESFPEPDRIYLVSRPPKTPREIQAPWTKLAGGCLFTLDLRAPAEYVPLQRTIVHYAGLSIVNDCVERTNKDGGLFSLDDAYVALRHPTLSSNPAQTS